MLDFRDEPRIIQESVPGKQVTVAHVISSPVQDIYDNLGIEDFGAIGILTLSPFETAMIAADIASKAANIEISFLDRFTGSVVISGDVEAVEVALETVTEKLQNILGYTVCEVTKT